MAAPGVTLIKSFTYRGNPEEWSNQYHIQGSAPSTPAAWRSLVDDLVALEKTCYTTETTVVRAICYENTDDDAVYTYNLADFAGVVHGTCAPTSGAQAGDVAVLARWGTGRTSTKGKPIYLYKFFHDAWAQASPNEDNVNGTQYDAVYAFAEDVMTTSGDWPGMAGKDGVAPTGWHVGLYLTTRTLKRRGRRPT